MPPLRPLAATAVAVLAAGCYRVTVVTTAAAPSAAAATVDKPWNNSFVYGLVPPPPVDVSRPCAGGVSRVVTQRSFLNSLVGGLTWGIYTPLQITATCGGGGASSRGLEPVRLGAAAEPAPSVSAAPVGAAAAPAVAP